MASIRKLPNGHFQATIYVGRDANGKQIRKYVTRKREKDCIRAARAIEKEIDEGRFVDIQNIKFSTWADKWLELHENTISPSTYMSYKTYIEKHYKPAFKNLKLSQINDIHIKQFMSDKLKTLSTTTVRKHMLVLRRILEDVLKHKNPARDIKIPQNRKYVPHLITEEEFNMIYNEFKNTRYELIILLAAWCGLRRGEIFALKWDDIDYKNKTITIDEALTISEDGYVFGEPKSDNGKRTIAVSDYLLNLLDKKRKKDKKIGGRIFSGRPDNFSSVFSEKMKYLGLPIRFHDLRHYHASFLYKNNIPDLYAAERLGHDIQVLKGIYQHLGLDKKEQLDNVIRGFFETM